MKGNSLFSLSPPYNQAIRLLQTRVCCCEPHSASVDSKIMPVGKSDIYGPTPRVRVQGGTWRGPGHARFV